MENYCDYMFKVPILHVSVKEWEEKKKILLDMIDDNISIDKEETVISDYHDQTNNQVNIQNIQKVSEILKEEIEFFCKYFSFPYYKVVMSWFQTSLKGHYHGVHNHGSVGYSAVCYVDFDHTEHNPTKFISPFTNFITGDILEYSPKVKEGSIVFFPSIIPHYSEPNKSDKKRIILSFNIDVKENENQRPRYS